jgi:hypothetical protein
MKSESTIESGPPKKQVPRRLRLATFLTLSLGLAFPAPTRAAADESPNFSIHYKVRVSAKDPLHPRVAVVLRGADEVESVTSMLPESRYLHFNGDGQITQIGSDILWKPTGLFSTLNYEVVIPHERRKGVYDSYGKRDWVITRTSDLFPRKRILFGKPAKSYTTVGFDLPAGWDVVSSMPEESDALFRAPVTEASYDWPTGWLIYGKVTSTVIKAEDARITLAYPEAFVRPPKRTDAARTAKRKKYLDWFNGKIRQADDIYSKVIPLMTKFLPKYAKSFLVIMGKDPMWHGGLSGENSLYIHRGVPNISEDRTSTLIHEYFHVCAGFNKDPRDAEWFIEGLAEYFSIRLLYDAGILTKEEFHAGIDMLASQGTWGYNLTRSKKRLVLYKNAPVVLYYLDESIRAKTGGKKSLKDAMAPLAELDKPVSTAMFKAELEEINGAPLDAEFSAYVTGGKKPDYKAFFK